MKPQIRLGVAAGAITAVTSIFAAISGLTTGASATAPAPIAAPGNNGDFKIDGPPYDPDHNPSNEPHVTGCQLQVDFYNYDPGQVANVAFSDSAPTANGGVMATGPAAVQLNPTAGGPKDFYGYATYTLSFSGIPQPNQGFHVRITVTVAGAAKYKEFYVEGCSPTPPTTTATTAPTTTMTTAPTTTITTAPTTTITTSDTTAPTTTITTAPTTTITTSDTTAPTTTITTAPTTTAPTTTTSDTTAPTTAPTTAVTSSTAATVLPTTQVTSATTPPRTTGTTSPPPGSTATTPLPLCCPPLRTHPQPHHRRTTALPPTAVDAGLADRSRDASSPAQPGGTADPALGLGAGLSLVGAGVVAMARRRRDAA